MKIIFKISQYFVNFKRILHSIGERWSYSYVTKRIKNYVKKLNNNTY